MNPQSSLVPHLKTIEDYRAGTKIITLPINGYHLQVTPFNQSLGLLLVESVNENTGQIQHYWITDAAKFPITAALAIASIVCIENH
jgi:hypothetical protein